MFTLNSDDVLYKEYIFSIKPLTYILAMVAIAILSDLCPLESSTCIHN